MAITESVDYLQRCVPLSADLGGGHTTGDPPTRRLLRVHAVTRTGGDPDGRALGAGERWTPHTAGLITGLYGYRIPLAFSLFGGPDGVEVRIGTWSTRAGAETQDRRRDVIGSVLSGLYGSATLEE